MSQQPRRASAVLPGRARPPDRRATTAGRERPGPTAAAWLAGVLIIGASLVACTPAAVQRPAAPTSASSTVADPDRIPSPSGGQVYPGTLCRGLNVPPVETPVPRPRLDPGFVAVSVVRCDVENEEVAGQGDWLVLVERHATSGITTLTDAVRQPDQPPPVQGCGIFIPEVWFLDAAGHAVLPRWPSRSYCTPPEVLDSVPWTTITRVRVRHLG